MEHFKGFVVLAILTSWLEWNLNDGMIFKLCKTYHQFSIQSSSEETKGQSLLLKSFKMNLKLCPSMFKKCFTTCVHVLCVMSSFHKNVWHKAFISHECRGTFFLIPHFPPHFPTYEHFLDIYIYTHTMFDWSAHACLKPWFKM